MRSDALSNNPTLLFSWLLPLFSWITEFFLYKPRLHSLLLNDHRVQRFTSTWHFHAVHVIVKPTPALTCISLRLNFASATLSIIISSILSSFCYDCTTMTIIKPPYVADILESARLRNTSRHNWTTTQTRISDIPTHACQIDLWQDLVQCHWLEQTMQLRHVSVAILA